MLLAYCPVFLYLMNPQRRVRHFELSDGVVAGHLTEVMGGESDHLTVCLPGGGGAVADWEPFNRLAVELAKRGIDTLQLDWAGNGISSFGEGDVRYTQGMCLSSLVHQLEGVLGLVDRRYDRLSLVAHSFGCAVATEHDNQTNGSRPVDKMVFLAPGNGMATIFRWNFVRYVAPHLDAWQTAGCPELTADNYEQFLPDADTFAAICMAGVSETKPEPFIRESMNGVYVVADDRRGDVLHVHGTNDKSAPVWSVPQDFPERVLIEGGNHFLLKPEHLEQWMPRAVAWIVDPG